MKVVATQIISPFASLYAASIKKQALKAAGFKATVKPCGKGWTVKIQ